jgi:hypothetical protein
MPAGIIDAHCLIVEYKMLQCIAAVEAAAARRNRLEVHIDAMLPCWLFAPVVRSLQAPRGMAMVAAATLVAELGDIGRFANPPPHGVSRPGSFRTFQRQHAASGRDYQGR